MVTDSKPKIGLALGSGSSRGWAHIGIIQALKSVGIEPDVICGCSIGSLVAAAHVSDNLHKLEHWVKTLNRLNTIRFFEVNFSLNGFVNQQRFYEFLMEYVCGEAQTIESLPLPFASVATELCSGREVWFNQGRLIDAVLASIAMPGLFQPFYYKDEWLVDGGLVNPVPVSVCRALGADMVIAVNLNSDIVGKHFKQGAVRDKQMAPTNGNNQNIFNSIMASAREYSELLFPNQKQQSSVPGILETIAGSINITQDRITRSRMAGDPPDIVLRPRLAHIGLFEFYRGAEAIKEGEQCVKRMLPEIEFTIRHMHH